MAPVWKYQVDLADVWQSNMTFAQKRDLTVARIRKSEWYLEEYDQLKEVVDNLEDSPNLDEFDCYWNELYDFADYHRAWIATF